MIYRGQQAIHTMKGAWQSLKRWSYAPYSRHSRHLCTTSSAVFLLQTSCPRLSGNQEEEEEQRGGGVFCRGPEPTEEGAQHIEQNSHAEEEADGKARGKVLREVGRGFQSSNERGKCSQETSARRRTPNIRPTRSHLSLLLNSLSLSLSLSLPHLMCT